MTSKLPNKTISIIPYQRDYTDDFFYPDPDPKPDSLEQNFTINECAYLLHDYFSNRPDVLVDSGGSIYYDRQDRMRAHVAPDLYITFGIDAAAAFERNNFLVWEVGKPPDFALEVASTSTHRVDTGTKPALYASIGVGEYWRFDPSGGRYYGYQLAGDALVEGEYRPLPVSETEDGLIEGYSAALDLYLCVRDRRLFLRDAATGTPVPSITEERAARQAAEAEAERLREEIRRLRGQ